MSNEQIAHDLAIKLATSSCQNSEIKDCKNVVRKYLAFYSELLNQIKEYRD